MMLVAKVLVAKDDALFAGQNSHRRTYQRLGLADLAANNEKIIS